MTVTVPLVGGPGDGETVRAVVDADGRPPLTHSFMDRGSLSGAAVYELEAIDGTHPTWRYRFRPAPPAGPNP